MDNLRKTILGCKQRRTPKRQRKILGNGVTSIRAPGIKLLIVTPRNLSWMRRNPMNYMSVPTLILNQKGGDKSSTQNPSPHFIPPRSSSVN
jgi:hypothetical protein